MGDLSDFQRGQIVGAHLAGASVTKMTVLLGASRASVLSVVTAYTNHGTTSSAEKNIGRKPKLSERD
jgi:transposase